MINKVQAQKFCGEDISLIENYEEAVNDKINMWDCHHVWGTMLGYTRQELKELDEYYGIPACNLIFLTREEHVRLHKKGKKLSEDHREKLSESHIGKKLSKEHREKIGESLKGEKNPFYGKHHREDTKKKISESKKGQLISEETRKKLSESNINNTKLSKPILQYTLDGQFIAEYPSLSEAERQTGINHANICKTLKCLRKSAGGFIFKYKY